MIVVAIGWQVYHLHNNPLDLGLVGLAEFLPLLVLALPAGALADRASRRVIAIAAGVLNVCIAGVLLVITVNGDAPRSGRTSASACSRARCRPSARPRHGR